MFERGLSQAKIQKKIKTTKTNCPFKLNGRLSFEIKRWHIIVTNQSHNHDPTPKLALAQGRALPQKKKMR
jgi:hypothetical protein